MSHDFYESQAMKTAYVGKRAKDFNYLITAQAESVYRARGIVFPVVVSSTIYYLYRNGPAAMADIAKALEHPHQTIAQHAATLTKCGLIEKRADKNDRRRSLFYLTRRGKEQAQRLEDLSSEAAQVFGELFEELGIDVAAVLEAAQEALKSRPLIDRFPQADKFKNTA